MTINVACPTCGKTLKAPPSAAGKRAKCPGCGGVVTIPADDVSSPTPAGQIPIVEPLAPWPPDAEAPAPTPKASPAPRAKSPSAADKIDVPCPHCGKTLKAPSSLAGKRVKCPACGGAMTVPGASGPEEIGLAEEPPEVAPPRPKPKAAPARPAKPAAAPVPAAGMSAASAMPTMSISCPHCRSTWSVPAAMGGQQIKCPRCSTLVALPQTLSQAEVVDAEPEDYSPEKPLAGVSSGPSPFTDEDFAVAKPAASSEPDRRPCPKCGELIAVGAAKCRFCGDIFDPTLRKAEGKKKRKREYSDAETDMTGGDWVVAIFCSGIGCIAGLIWLIQGKPKGGKMLAVSLGVQVVLFIVKFLVVSARQGSTPGLH